MNSRLRRYRLKNGYTQKELAQLLNMPYRTYQNYEEGTNSMPSWLAELILFRLRSIVKYDRDHGIYKLKQIKFISIPILLKYNATSGYVFGDYAIEKADEKSSLEFLVCGEITTINKFKLQENLESEFQKRVFLYFLEDYDESGEFITEIYKKGKQLFNLNVSNKKK